MLHLKRIVVDRFVALSVGQGSPCKYNNWTVVRLMAAKLISGKPRLCNQRQRNERMPMELWMKVSNSFVCCLLQQLLEHMSNLMTEIAANNFKSLSPATFTSLSHLALPADNWHSSCCCCCCCSSRTCVWVAHISMGTLSRWSDKRTNGRTKRYGPWQAIAPRTVNAVQTTI